MLTAARRPSTPRGTDCSARRPRAGWRAAGATGLVARTAGARLREETARISSKSADGDDGGGAHAERAVRIALLEPDAHRKAIGEAHPVERAPHRGQHA